ncbi:MAG: hypothetical protein ACK5LT_12860 [Lachnospirales bacterium]
MRTLFFNNFYLCTLSCMLYLFLNKFKILFHKSRTDSQGGRHVLTLSYLNYFQKYHFHNRLKFLVNIWLDPFEKIKVNILHKIKSGIFTYVNLSGNPIICGCKTYKKENETLFIISEQGMVDILNDLSTYAPLEKDMELDYYSIQDFLNDYGLIEYIKREDIELYNYFCGDKEILGYKGLSIADSSNILIDSGHLAYTTWLFHTIF